MTTKNIQIRPVGAGDFADVLHPETNTDMVIDKATGKTVREAFENLIDQITIKTIWVDSVNGSDTTGDGTTNYPYKTFLYAFNTLNSFSHSVTFRLKTGTYAIDTGGLNVPYKFIPYISITGDNTTPTNVNITSFSTLNIRALNSFSVSGVTLENTVVLQDFECPTVNINSIRGKTGRTQPFINGGVFETHFIVSNIIANNLSRVFGINGGLWTFSTITGSGNSDVFYITGAIVTSSLSSNTITGTRRVYKSNGGQFFES